MVPNAMASSSIGPITPSVSDCRIRFKLNDIRWDMSGAGIPQIRLFGRTDNDQSVAASLSGSYPYIYLRYSEDLSIEPQVVQAYIASLRESLERIINQTNGRASKQPTTIPGIAICKGVPFYGYHVGYSVFLKVYLSDPRKIKPMCTLLRSGAVMGIRHDVYEEHIPYLLQVMLDFNLYGCDWVYLGNRSSVRFVRVPRKSSFVNTKAPSNSADSVAATAFSARDYSAIPSDWLTNEVLPCSTCSIEVSATVWDILNPRSISERDIHHDFEYAEKRKASGKMRYMPSIKELWEKLDKNKSFTTAEDDRSQNTKGGFSNTNEFNYVDFDEMYRNAVKMDEVDPNTSYDSFVSSRLNAKYEDKKTTSALPTQWLPLIRTVFQQREALNPEQILSDEQTAYVYQTSGGKSDMSNYSPAIEKVSSEAFVQEDHDEDATYSSNNESDPDDEDEEALSEEVNQQKDQERSLTEADILQERLAQTRQVSFSNILGPSQKSSDLSKTPSSLTKSAGNLVEDGILDDIPTLSDYVPTPTLVHSASDDRSYGHSMSQPSASQQKKNVSAFQTISRFGRTDGPAYFYDRPPPSVNAAYNAMDFYNLPRAYYQDPFYGDKKDIPNHTKEYGGRLFKVGAKTQAFDFCTRKNSNKKKISDIGNMSMKTPNLLEYAAPPPSINECRKSERPSGFKSDVGRSKSHVLPTVEQNAPDQDKLHLTIMTLEVFSQGRPGRLPDPLLDQINCIFYCIQSSSLDSLNTGVVLVGDDEEVGQVKSLLPRRVHVDYVDNETELFDFLIHNIVQEYDPDICTGYEIEELSWGYLVKRAKHICEWDLELQLGRLIEEDFRIAGSTTASVEGISFSGRHTFSLWAVLKRSLKLANYSMEHVVIKILKRQFPAIPHASLRNWWCEGEWGSKSLRVDVLKFFISCVETQLEVLEKTELVYQISEEARTFGLDFRAALLRGSQFKVESVMCRIGKPENFVLISPTRKQVGEQAAAECQPLILEPQSAFYKGPMVVLDFQSLYPSLMIAYNYCYSTCLGSVKNMVSSPGLLGFLPYSPERGLIALTEKDTFVSPNGLVFVRSHMRLSLLSKMLLEILETRVMIKSKLSKTTSKLERQQLDARQMALKLLASVTYGYTSASFSGRMPCVEIADAIVETGRQTLENAMSLIQANYDGATVVYGDTDSMFVYLPGRTREEAFKLGREMADMVTKANPAPVKLKFEKVYLPSVLVAKKRYVGNKFEAEGQTEGVLDAKGIEVVRRDYVPAAQKLQEQCLRTLFKNPDLSEIKRFCQKEFIALLQNTAHFEDYVFSKAVKLGTYAPGRRPPPAAALAMRLAETDHRSKPQYNERVRFLIVEKENATLLVDKTVSVSEYIRGSHRLDADYYISRILVPPLERVFNLMGVDVASWYREVRGKKKNGRIPGAMGVFLGDTSTIDAVSSESDYSAIRKQHRLDVLCIHCSGLGAPSNCLAVDCPVFQYRFQI